MTKETYNKWVNSLPEIDFKGAEQDNVKVGQFFKYEGDLAEVSDIVNMDNEDGFKFKVYESRYTTVFYVPFDGSGHVGGVTSLKSEYEYDMPNAKLMDRIKASGASINESFDMSGLGFTAGNHINVSNWDDMEDNFKSFSKEKAFATLPLWFNDGGKFTVNIKNTDADTATGLEVDVTFADGNSALSNQTEINKLIASFLQDSNNLPQVLNEAEEEATAPKIYSLDELTGIKTAAQASLNSMDYEEFLRDWEDTEQGAGDVWPQAQVVDALLARHNFTNTDVVSEEAVYSTPANTPSGDVSPAPFIADTMRVSDYGVGTQKLKKDDWYKMNEEVVQYAGSKLGGDHHTETIYEFKTTNGDLTSYKRPNIKTLTSNPVLESLSKFGVTFDKFCKIVEAVNVYESSTKKMNAVTGRSRTEFSIQAGAHASYLKNISEGLKIKDLEGLLGTVKMKVPTKIYEDASKVFVDGIQSLLGDKLNAATKRISSNVILLSKDMTDEKSVAAMLKANGVEYPDVKTETDGIVVTINESQLQSIYEAPVDSKPISKTISPENQAIKDKIADSLKKLKLELDTKTEEIKVHIGAIQEGYKDKYDQLKSTKDTQVKSLEGKENVADERERIMTDYTDKKEKLQKQELADTRVEKQKIADLETEAAQKEMKIKMMDPDLTPDQKTALEKWFTDKKKTISDNMISVEKSADAIKDKAYALIGESLKKKPRRLNESAAAAFPYDAVAICEAVLNVAKSIGSNSISLGDLCNMLNSEFGHNISESLIVDVENRLKVYGLNIIYEINENKGKKRHKLSKTGKKIVRLYEGENDPIDDGAPESVPAEEFVVISTDAANDDVTTALTEEYGFNFDWVSVDADKLSAGIKVSTLELVSPGNGVQYFIDMINALAMDMSVGVEGKQMSLEEIEEALPKVYEGICAAQNIVNANEARKAREDNPFTKDFEGLKTYNSIKQKFAQLMGSVPEEQKGDVRNAFGDANEALPQRSNESSKPTDLADCRDFPQVCEFLGIEKSLGDKISDVVDQNISDKEACKEVTKIIGDEAKAKQILKWWGAEDLNEAEESDVKFDDLKKGDILKLKEDGTEWKVINVTETSMMVDPVKHGTGVTQMWPKSRINEFTLGQNVNESKEDELLTKIYSDNSGSEKDINDVIFFGVDVPYAYVSIMDKAGVKYEKGKNALFGKVPDKAEMDKLLKYLVEAGENIDISESKIESSVTRGGSPIYPETLEVSNGEVTWTKRNKNFLSKTKISIPLNQIAGINHKDKLIGSDLTISSTGGETIAAEGFVTDDIEKILKELKPASTGVNESMTKISSLSEFQAKIKEMGDYTESTETPAKTNFKIGGKVVGHWWNEANYGEIITATNESLSEPMIAELITGMKEMKDEFGDQYPTINVDGKTIGMKDLKEVYQEMWLDNASKQSGDWKTKASIDDVVSSLKAAGWKINVNEDNSYPGDDKNFNGTDFNNDELEAVKKYHKSEGEFIDAFESTDKKLNEDDKKWLSGYFNKK